MWMVNKTLTDSMAELRTCLFFEQRRWRHFGETSDKESMTYIRAIIKAIRDKVKKEEKE